MQYEPGAGLSKTEIMPAIQYALARLAHLQVKSIFNKSRRSENKFLEFLGLFTGGTIL